MTREEAIRIIENRDSIMDYCESQALGEALDMAIKALQQEPCEDAVSRQEVLNIIDDMAKEYYANKDFDKAQGIAWVKLQRLPSVNPQKIGHWIIDKEKLGYYISKCSACEHIFHGNEILIYRPKYCANCGAKMIEPMESEDKE